MNKKKFGFLINIIGLVSIFSTLVFLGIANGQVVPSVSVGNCYGAAKPAEQFNQQDVYCVFVRLADWMFGILMALAVIFVIYAAYLYLTSADNPDNTEKARNQLIYAAVAIAVALLSRGVESLVRAFLGINQG